VSDTELSFEEAREVVFEFVRRSALRIGSRARLRALLNLVIWAKRREADHDGTDHGGLADVAAVVREVEELYIAALPSASFYHPSSELREQLRACIAEMVDEARRSSEARRSP
jgi:hypothetical protein